MLMRALAPLLIAVALILAPPLPGGDTSDDTLVVVGGTLIDGTGSAPRPAALIVIRAGVIREVTAGEASIPAGARRVEARQACDTSNAYVVPGISLHRELELLVDSGLSPMEALLAATRTAADFLGQASALGTVEPGKAADLVVLARDPLGSITATRDVEVVIRAGRVVWRK